MEEQTKLAKLKEEESETGREAELIKSQIELERKQMQKRFQAEKHRQELNHQRSAAAWEQRSRRLMPRWSGCKGKGAVQLQEGISQALPMIREVNLIATELKPFRLEPDLIRSYRRAADNKACSVAVARQQRSFSFCIQPSA